MEKWKKERKRKEIMKERERERERGGKYSNFLAFASKL